MTPVQDLRKWRERFSALLQEGITLLKRLEEQEERHRLLQESLSQPAVSNDEELADLNKLYGDGFHICHACFALPRDGECLFCMSFLQNKGVFSSSRQEE
jgi:regulator of replication initiation timing